MKGKTFTDLHKEEIAKSPFGHLLLAIIEDKQDVSWAKKNDLDALKVVQRYQSSEGAFFLGNKFVRPTDNDIKLIFGIACGTRRILLVNNRKPKTSLICEMSVPQRQNNNDKKFEDLEESQTYAWSTMITDYLINELDKRLTQELVNTPLESLEPGKVEDSELEWTDEEKKKKLSFVEVTIDKDEIEDDKEHDQEHMQIQNHNCQIQEENEMLRSENTNLKKQIAEKDEKIIMSQKTLSDLQSKNGKDDTVPPANVTQVYQQNKCVAKFCDRPLEHEELMQRVFQEVTATGPISMHSGSGGRA
ncbi:hypothetical protein RHGRI_013449 [Rhododendron griersonianum]|uniref:Uncharacterized protein n=1 Tax=Rhododendron griersonianum TaxID=479676 RepID=A0AAV6K5K8_9ERIC|nr:hypothetical protein RHGRI_013449 [Rhododendron griersonianum]